MSLNVYQQGVGSVDSVGLNSFEQTCDNVAAARAFTGITGIQIFVRGIVSPGDGGAGPFYWDANSTATDDNGASVIAPTASTMGRWIRLGFLVVQGLGGNGAPVGNGGLIISSGLNLTSNLDYGFKSSLGAMSATLPQLSTVLPGSIIRLQDMDNDAFANNFTVNAFGGDQIFYDATNASSTVLNIKGVYGQWRANTTYWRFTFYVS